MKKILLIIAMTVVGISAQAQLLWKVSGNGLQKPSYIFGTHHYAPLTVLDSVPQIRQVQNDVEQVCGEVDMLNTRDLPRLTAEAIMLPPGSSLNDFIPDADRPTVDKAMRSLIGFGLDNPAVQRMCPAAISNQLIAAIVTKYLPKVSLDQQLDTYFQIKADKAGKKVLALETAQDQLKMLFSQPPARQGKMLVCLAENTEWNASIIEMATDAYMHRDIETLKEVTNQKLGDDCDSTPEEDAMLLSNRNRAWMEQIPKMLANAPTLVVVGAAHLVGDEGLLSLLRQSGYTVDPVDKR